jgi:uncharacterized protein YkwD
MHPFLAVILSVAKDPRRERRVRGGRGSFAALRMTVGVLCGLLAASPLHAVDWYALTPDEFARLPAAQARIDSANFNRELMSAAIFHETNRTRRRLGLPTLTHVIQLDAAADLKATIGVVGTTLRHENPLPMTATPADRVTAVGLDFARVAENIARLSSYDLPDGTTALGIRERGGQTEFYRLDTGRPPELQTYGGFAAVVVASWMESPGHRANITDTRLVSLGCSARPCRSLMSHHEQVYAVQVFYTPRRGK